MLIALLPTELAWFCFWSHFDSNPIVIGGTVGRSIRKILFYLLAICVSMGGTSVESASNLGVFAEGKRRSLILRITGATSRIDKETDKIHLSIVRERFLIGDKMEFQGLVPTELFEYQGKDFLAKIGQLKFAGDSEIFKSGVKLRLQVRVEQQATENLKPSIQEIELHVSQ